MHMIFKFAKYPNNFKLIELPFSNFCEVCFQHLVGLKLKHFEINLKISFLYRWLELLPKNLEKLKILNVMYVNWVSINKKVKKKTTG